MCLLFMMHWRESKEEIGLPEAEDTVSRLERKLGRQPGQDMEAWEAG